MITLRRIFTTIGLAFLVAGMLSLVRADDKAADDWALFRGNPRQTGIARSSLPDNLEILWQFKAKDSFDATAAISHGVVYAASMDENLYAIDLKTGQQKWTYKVAPFKAPPSVDKDLVYVGDGDGMFHCVEAATGKKRWTFQTGSEISSGANFVGDAVLFGSGDENLYCLTKEGKPRWTFKVPGGPVMGSPAVVEGRTFAAGCDSTLHVLDLANGKEVGNGLELGGQVGATVAVEGDQLFVGTMSSQFLAINWKKGDVLWTFEAENRRQPFYASAALSDTLIIAGSRDKNVYGLDRKSGKKVWSFATRNRVEGSPVVVGQRVFVGSQDKNLYVLDLKTGQKLKEFELSGPISASPAVAENRLVIGTADGTLYCFGAKN